MTDLEIAAYIDHGLKSQQIKDVEEHFARCSECRENVIHTQELIERSRRSRRLAATAAIVLAAAAIAIVAVPSLRRPIDEKRDALRSDETTQSLVAYGPAGETVTNPVRFTWGSLPGAISYHITVMRDNGSEVWSASSTDTTIVLPLSVQLDRGKKFSWVVDAVANDGTTRSTGLREFGIVR